MATFYTNGWWGLRCSVWNDANYSVGGVQWTNLYSYNYNYLDGCWGLYASRCVMCGYYAVYCLSDSDLVWDCSENWPIVYGSITFDAWLYYRESTVVYSKGVDTNTIVTSTDPDTYPCSGYLLTGDIIGWFELVDE